MASFDKINNGTHGRYPVPVGMILNVSPFDTSSEIRATSSVSGLGAWGPTSSPIQIGPFNVYTEIVIEVRKGSALVEVQFPGTPGGGAPVTVTGTGAVGSTLTAVLAPGWTATGYQWNRDGVPISGATASTYTLISGDGGHVVTLTVSGLVYTPTGVTVPPVTVIAWDDTQNWADNATWTD